MSAEHPPFDAVAWANRHCDFRNNPLFHAHPDLPCGRFCFADLWQWMADEYGAPTHGMERHNTSTRVEWNEEHQRHVSQRQLWDEKERQLQAKRVEHDRRLSAILALVKQKDIDKRS